MKRCPNCNRLYLNVAQKFCTQDGTPLLNTTTLPSGQGDTIRIDGTQLDSAPFDDEATRPISRDLTTGDLDPYKTMVNEPRAKPPVPEDQFDLTMPASPRLYSGSLADTSAEPAPPPVSAPLPPPTRPLEQQPSAPLPPSGPPPPSGALPPSAPPAPSAPLPTSAPLAPPPAVAAPQPPAPSPARAARPAKKSRVPLVLGILAVLLVLGIAAAVAGYFFVLRPMQEAQRIPAQPSPTPAATPVAQSTATPETRQVKEVPPYSPPADAVQFVNSNETLDGKLKEHYLDFSFYYPKRWLKDPKSGVPGATNFAKVQSQLAADAPQEIFAVGWYESTGSPETDKASYPRLVEQRSAQFAKEYPEYKKVSEGPAHVGSYDGYEFRFEALYRNTDKGDIHIWGRVIFLPPPEEGSRKGVTLLMLASSLAQGVAGTGDVGVKGELPMLLDSFRFGK